MLSYTEENYLKCIYKLSRQGNGGVSTNAISAEINTTAASVTDMLKKLAEKGLLDYIKYKGVNLTPEGEHAAKLLIRKHRLWEVFLVEKLKFSWDEVHEIAEQLEHIHSTRLIQRLDEYLGFPKFDPHGDPIPDQHGNYYERHDTLLSDLLVGDKGIIAGVKDHSSLFLQYLDAQKLLLGVQIEVLRQIPYDNSLIIKVSDGRELTISQQVAANLFIRPLK